MEGSADAWRSVRESSKSALKDCVTDALGETLENFFGLEPEQFAAIAKACEDELLEGFGDFPALGVDGVGWFGGFGGRGGAGAAGGSRVIGFSSMCVSDAAGRPVEGPQDLRPDGFQKILTSCT